MVQPSVSKRPPSSRPSPQGEGESFAARLKCRRTELTGWVFAKPESRNGCSFSPGEKVRMRASVTRSLLRLGHRLGQQFLDGGFHVLRLQPDHADDAFAIHQRVSW